jgi:putative proteasome-type protease
MTYCLGIRVDEGLVMLADTRTNAGVDHIARYGKMFTWERPGEWAVCICTAGNLSITQGVVNALNEGVASGGRLCPSLFDASGMYAVAELVGEQMRRLEALHGPTLARAGVSAGASMLIAGQKAGERHRLFQLYDAGNFIEADEDTPYLQIGEFKYGKPILDRVLTHASEIPDAMKAAFLSMDSTIRSNLSVAAPLDLAVIRADALAFETRRRVWEDDPGLVAISKGWSRALFEAFRALPPVG